MSFINFENLPPVIGGLTGTEKIPLNQAGTTKYATSLQVAGAILVPFPAAIEFVIDGANSLIQTQTWGYLTVPFDATVSRWTLLGNQVGDIVVDVWKCTYSDFDAGVTHPVLADSITGTDTPTLSGAAKNQSTNLTGWTTTLTTGDILAFRASGAVTMTRVTLTLDITRALS